MPGLGRRFEGGPLPGIVCSAWLAFALFFNEVIRL